MHGETVKVLNRLSKNSLNVEFHENPSSGSRSCSMQTDGEKDIAKLIVAFCNFANTPKILKEHFGTDR